MKRFSLFFIVLGILTLGLAACGDDNNASNTDETETDNTEELEYEPEDIDPDTDVCEVCGMSIEDDQYATEIVLKNDKVLKFDDLGDLYVWLNENGEDEIGAKFVRDFNTEKWLQLEDATFVYDEEISTPMGFGVISFENEKDAEKYIDENGRGELLSATELDAHEWDADHDHDHGFETAGFDMHFTELDDVKVAEETELEVSITIDEEALEGADVRYEIWEENKEDNTDWIDAEEMDAGEYLANYTFEENETYHIQVHVEDDDDLHEHMNYEVNVKE